MLKKILKFNFFNCLVFLLIGFLSNFLYADQSPIPKFTESSKNYSKIISSNEKKENLSLEVKQLILEARKRAEQYFNFKTGHFKLNITKQEKQRFYNDLLDSLVISDKEFYRFDRTEKQDFITDGQRKQQELVIQEIVDRCVKYIGEEPKDNKMLVMKQGDLLSTVSLSLPNTKDSKEIIENIQNNYLQDRVQKCVTYIYGDSYSLKDFEYYDVTKSKTDKQRKQYWIDETLYPELYFEIKKAGLLRYIPSAYYPKAIVRDYSGEVGLSLYIKKEQKTVHKLLNHEEQASHFFGDYKKWRLALNKYINSRMTANEILARQKVVCKSSDIDDNKNLVGFTMSIYNKNGNECVRYLIPNKLFDYRDELYTDIAKYYDIDTRTYNKGVTDLQKQKVADAFLDIQAIMIDVEMNRIDTDNSQYYRLNRQEQQPYLSIEKQYIIGIKINILLDQCILTIDPLINLNRFTSKISWIDKVYSIDFIKRKYKLMSEDFINYLNKKTKKCIYSLYGDYSLKDFNAFKAKSLDKAMQSELFYQKAYLYIKTAGLLRRINYAFYPKSLIRLHADKIGLTKYIKEKEEKKEGEINHRLLTIEYFHGYENWIKSLNVFINVEVEKFNKF